MTVTIVKDLSAEKMEQREEQRNAEKVKRHEKKLSSADKKILENKEKLNVLKRSMGRDEEDVQNKKLYLRNLKAHVTKQERGINRLNALDPTAVVYRRFKVLPVLHTTTGFLSFTGEFSLYGLMVHPKKAQWVFSTTHRRNSPMHINSTSTVRRKMLL